MGSEEMPLEENARKVAALSTRAAEQSLEAALLGLGAIDDKKLASAIESLRKAQSELDRAINYERWISEDRSNFDGPFDAPSQAKGNITKSDKIIYKITHTLNVLEKNVIQLQLYKLAILTMAILLSGGNIAHHFHAIRETIVSFIHWLLPSAHAAQVVGPSESLQHKTKEGGPNLKIFIQTVVPTFVLFPTFYIVLFKNGNNTNDKRHSWDIIKLILGYFLGYTIHGG
jgi:hypothetical protein